MQEFTVRFSGVNKEVRVSKGTDLLDAAAKCGIAIHSSCGGSGTCGKCKIIVHGPIDDGRVGIKNVSNANGTELLACQSFVTGDVDVTIPKSSLERGDVKETASSEYTKGIVIAREKLFKHKPLIEKRYIELASQVSSDGNDPLEAICKALGVIDEKVFVSIDASCAEKLKSRLGECFGKCTIVVGHKDDGLEILAAEPGDTTKRLFGIAFDIGTTTVVGQLIDLNSGQVIASRISFNRQASYGSDVITRIIYASEPNGLNRLNDAVLSNMNDMLAEFIAKENIEQDEIYGSVCAGNMTMMHLLLRIDPSGIRKAPYMPDRVTFHEERAADIGLGINRNGLIAFVPGVSTYIGGDIVAGVVACGLSENDDLTLLVDIGTNGEIVLGNKEWMIGTAASAGPAFEGSGLVSGMKAVSGAVQKLFIDENLDATVKTIGDARPAGICGSGYIDLLCQMLKRGIMTKDGKINRDAKTKRIRKNGANFEYVLVYADGSDTGKDIVIQDDDIENLKRAKGAIYSAILALANKVGQGLGDIKKIYIAGGFGNYLNIENAIHIGLLPDIDRSIYEFIGNSSLAGARMSLLSRDAACAADEIHGKITYLDLSSEPGYMDEYVAALFFPHTDIRRFPSAR